ncbi:polyhydroxyalkanoate depolymerase [Falsirhodobacter deserti]|uniref:polyhydroxyalkanoate depolymerase n=1 Tax=Falsirhodobacter deserti TaxID=1365611 RepID=UPI000FE389BE|nr:polyhydroxyalkanoate depolymerase [Falsirhodobacter deserti]
MEHTTGYDLMESLRITQRWMGATVSAMASYPMPGTAQNPMAAWAQAWGTVAERSFSRMAVKPDWGIRSIAMDDGTDHLVDIETLKERAFCNLIHFNVRRRAPMKRRVLLVPPMSGHHATLCRSTVASLLPDAEVFVADWKNARDVPLAEGRFDIEAYTLYLTDFIRLLGPETHVIAICQPAPLTLAATACLAADDPDAQPAGLILIGGPIDPDAGPTEVTDFGHRVNMGLLEDRAIQQVSHKYRGAGRAVYPGLMQLAGFMAINPDRHAESFTDQIRRVAAGEASDYDAHNRFYDEYLAVMDLPAEFYLSTVERIFKNREIARNAFTLAGTPVDMACITGVPLLTIEGQRDRITAPGQCAAAHDLLTGLPPALKERHLEPDAGHYGIFAGKHWRLNIRPIVLDFIDRQRRQI